MFSAIVAYDNNFGIGKNGKLPWYYPEDLKFFKQITIGKTILMGSKTFDSIGRILPNRRHVVFSRNTNKYKYLYNNSDKIFFNDNAEFFLKNNYHLNEEQFIIGGSEIFRISLRYLTYIYITKIDKTFDCDVFFPEIDFSDFQLISSRVKGDLKFFKYKNKKIYKEDKI